MKLLFRTKALIKTFSSTNLAFLISFPYNNGLFPKTAWILDNKPTVNIQNLKTAPRRKFKITFGG
jgi:hypothetical protein